LRGNFRCEDFGCSAAFTTQDGDGGFVTRGLDGKNERHGESVAGNGADEPRQ